MNPNDSDVQVNDIAYTLRMALRVKAAGARLLLDLHYSDTWADPGHQTTPAAWASLGFDSLEQRVETYSTDVVTQLKQAGALPDIVQVGNEIDGGMLWPLGQLYAAGADTALQWTAVHAPAQGGHPRRARRARPGRLRPHHAALFAGRQHRRHAVVLRPHDAYGVAYDLIGLSYYPWWHGTLADLQANLLATALRYGRDVDGRRDDATPGAPAAGRPWPRTAPP